MPEISVIVPVYNVAPFLPACLDSLTAQTFTDFEAILVDDGSTDESPAILRDYAARDGRFRVITRENGGLSAARNSGIAAASGTFLAFLDGDDVLEPDFLAALREAAGDGDVALCGFYYLYPDGSRKEAGTRHHLSEDPAREYVLAEPMAPVRLIRRALFSGLTFREGTLYEDLDLMPYLAALTDRIGFADRALYGYRQRGGSIMQSDFSLRWEDIFTVTENLAGRFEAAGRYERFEREIEFLFIEHLLRSAALRFCRTPEGKNLFPRLLSAVENRFPAWRDNPYLKRSSPAFRLVVRCAAKGRFHTVAMLESLRRKAGRS